MEIIDNNNTGFCPSCGRNINPEAFFCSHCGAAVGSKSRHSHHEPHYEPRRSWHMPTDTLALISLLISIFGFFAAGFFGPLAGVILGHVALNRINRSGGQLEGRGMAIAALIIGYFALFIGILLMVLIGSFIGFALRREGIDFCW